MFSSYGKKMSDKHTHTHVPTRNGMLLNSISMAIQFVIPPSNILMVIIKIFRECTNAVCNISPLTLGHSPRMAT